MKGDFAHLLVSRDMILALFQSAKVLPFFQFIKRGSFRGETGMKKEPIQIACPLGHPFFGVQERITVKCGYCDDDPQCVNSVMSRPSLLQMRARRTWPKSERSR
jgi:hypothetical protein